MKVHRLRLPGRSLCSIRSNRKWCKRRGSSLQCQNCFFVYPIIDCNLKNLYLFLKQLRMWTKAIKHQNKNISTNLINKQPVRFDVTLTRTFVVSCKVMIPVFCIQRTAIRQNIDYLKQLIKIFILLFASFKSFLN